eukprot:jgi/Chrzof1/9832/Cz04g17220.t1
MGFCAMEFEMESDMPHSTDPSDSSTPEARMSDSNDVPDSFDQVAHAVWSPLDLPDKEPLVCRITVRDSVEDDQLCYNMFNTTDAVADSRGDHDDVESPEMPDELVGLCIAAMAADAYSMHQLHQCSDCLQANTGGYAQDASLQSRYMSS